MKSLFFFAVLAAVIVGCNSQEVTPKTTAQSASPEYAKVQAIFDQSCIKCHSAERGPGQIRLASYELAMKGGEEGPIVTAGDPDNSELIKALKGQGAKQMPPKGGPLSADQIKVVEDWIKNGAKG